MLLRCFCLRFFIFKISFIKKNIKQKLSCYPQYLYYSGLAATSFRCLRVSSDMLLGSTSFLQILSMGFWLVIKFKKFSYFTSVFWNLLWSLKKFSFFLIFVSLSTITIELPLSDFWMTVCLFDFFIF